MAPGPCISIPKSWWDTYLLRSPNQISWVFSVVLSMGDHSPLSLILSRIILLTTESLKKKNTRGETERLRYRNELFKNTVRSSYHPSFSLSSTLTSAIQTQSHFQEGYWHVKSRTSLSIFYVSQKKLTTINVNLLPSVGLKSVLRMATNSDHKKFFFLQVRKF